MSAKHFRLVTLGRIALLTPAGEDADLGKRRRKLALLAVLALSRRPPTRDALAEMFWGDEDEDRARHSLSDALSHLRRVLGRDAIGARSEVVELDAAGRLAVDAAEFEAACEGRDWERAVALYGGTFLSDLFVDRSPTFEAWVARERDRYARLFAQACEVRCASLARDARWDDCRVVAARWLAVAPRAAEAATYLLRAGAAASDRETRRAALADWELHAARLARELRVQPDPRVEALAADLARRLEQDALAEARRSADGARRSAPGSRLSAEGGVEVEGVVAERRAPSEEDREPSAESRVPAPASRRSSSVVHLRVSRRALRWSALAAILVVVVGTLLALRRHAASDATLLDPTRPVVAITDIRPAPGDTGLAWLEDGLKQMMAADLARGRAVEVVAPPLVRNVVERAAWRGALDSAQQAELARRVRATWSLSGSIARSEGAYVLDVTLREARSGAVVKRYAVTGTDVLAVADQAAAFVLGTAGEQAAGPHLSDVETSNTEAYRHFVAGEERLMRNDEARAAPELDAAIAADSAFVSAIIARLHMDRTRQDPPTSAHLRRLLARAGSRVTEWDRLNEAAYAAFHNGEHARAEQLARELVARFPRDPRAYRVLEGTFGLHGKAAEAESALVRMLALDSLAMTAGAGPCAACAAYAGLVVTRAQLGDLAGAERYARRWVALQPGLADAWSLLAMVPSYEGRFDEARSAMRRAHAVEPETPWVLENEARLLAMAGRYNDALALVAPAVGDSAVGAMAADITATVQLERGQRRAALATMERARRRYADWGLDVLEAHVRGRAGDADAARRMLEARTYHGPDLYAANESRADAARAFAWHHALEADAIAERADTTYLAALADSIARIGAASYYGRDWRLPHHVRGLVAIRGQRWEEAIRELQQARWGVAGWTRTNVEIARAELALHRPTRALAVLRAAHEGPLDAMGHYVPRTELDWWMARAFQEAGQRDSARLYTARLRAAWANADPDVRARLAGLPE